VNVRQFFYSSYFITLNDSSLRRKERKNEKKSRNGVRRKGSKASRVCRRCKGFQPSLFFAEEDSLPMRACLLLHVSCFMGGHVALVCVLQQSLMITMIAMCTRYDWNSYTVISTLAYLTEMCCDGACLSKQKALLFQVVGRLSSFHPPVPTLFLPGVLL
jgi:hypothetical protein